MRRAKIVATLGPASCEPDTLLAMVEAGMDVARLNASHGTLAEHAATIGAVRGAAEDAGRPVATLLDLSGPKLRTAPTADGQSMMVSGGELVTLRPSTTSTATAIGVNYERVAEDVHPGDPILLDDGALVLEAEAREGRDLRCRVLQGGPLRSAKGVAFPASNLTLTALTDRDREAIAAGAASGVDLFGLSFVRDANHVEEARNAIRAQGSGAHLIAKIERRIAVENLEEIVAAADGVMVARGDLGVELAPEEVPVLQRRIIKAGQRHLSPVITATQMLESMTHSRRPTRAEASDVANAVWDSSDALMLSGETAVGDHPVATIAMMDRIIRRAEETAPPHPDPSDIAGDDHSHLIALASRRIADSDQNLRAIVCFTRSGYSAQLLATVRPGVPIVAASPNEAVWRRLPLAWGVVPVRAPLLSSADELLRAVDLIVAEGSYASPGDEVLVVGSLPPDEASTTNFLKLHRVGQAGPGLR